MLGAGMEGMASALEGSAKPARTAPARAPREHARTKHVQTAPALSRAAARRPHEHP
jgi:hypothetical protein